MVAYEFYFRNGKGEDHLIGILPERRHNPERITQESIMQWIGQVGQLIDRTMDLNKVYFIRVDV